MTAIPRRRKRRTVFAAVCSLVMMLGAGVMVFVGVSTLSNSKEGEAVGVDTRPHVRFPATPNAVLGVTADDGELASLVVVTLSPSGQGGSIVTIPVNADSTAGFGLQRRPINEVFEADDPTSLIDAAEEMLSIVVERALIVDADGLADLLEPIESVQVVLPRDVVDSSATAVAGSVARQVAQAGPQALDADEAADVLAAMDQDDVSVHDAHETDVAVWEAIAATAPLTTPPEAVEVDADGDPVAPATVEALLGRLWEGEVGVRDLALATLSASDNPTDADVVLLDRRDSDLVFAQISPSLVSTASTGLKTRVVAGFTPEQLEQSDGLFDTTYELVTQFIGQMLYVQNSVVSVDSASTGAPEVTQIVVTDEQFLADTEQAAEALFGQAEVRLADTVLEGVDIEVTLGMSYLIREMVRSGTDGGADGGSSTDSVPVGPDTVGTDG